MKAFSQKLGIAVAGLLLAAGPALAQRAGGGRAARVDRGGGGRSTTSSGGGCPAGGGGGGGNIAAGGGSASSSGGGRQRVLEPVGPRISVAVDQHGRRAVPLHGAGTPPELQPQRPAYAHGVVGRTGGATIARAAGSSRDELARSGGDRATPRSESGGDAGERAASRAGLTSGTPAAAAANEPATANNAAARTRSRTGAVRAGTSGYRRAVGVSARSRRATRATAKRTTATTTEPYDTADTGTTYDAYYYCGSVTASATTDSAATTAIRTTSPYGFGYGIPVRLLRSLRRRPVRLRRRATARTRAGCTGAQDQGSLKLKVKPRNAKVYVDGYYVGLVDDSTAPSRS
jgi:hypothetical protein